MLPTAQDTHFKASQCLSASSDTIFRVLSEWQSKTWVSECHSSPWSAAFNVSYLPSCCSANTALILYSLHTLLPIHTFCTPGCQLCAQLLSTGSSVPQAAAFLIVQSHQAKPACKPCQCLPSFHFREDFNPCSPSR